MKINLFFNLHALCHSVLKPNITSKIAPLLKFLFSKTAFSSVFLLSIVIFSVNFYTNYHSYSTFNVKTVLSNFIILMFIDTTLHELGHATASHYYKSKYGGIGFGFYLYFIPVFFADVTDIWRLNKWKRIVVNSSGVYFELVFYLILSIIGIILGNQSITIISFIISVKSLYNFLPFLRADGYWILSDLLNKPNLNYHSMNNLKVIIHSFFNDRILTFKMKDYFITLYGAFNIILLCIFFITNYF